MIFDNDIMTSAVSTVKAKELFVLKPTLSEWIEIVSPTLNYFSEL